MRELDLDGLGRRLDALAHDLRAELPEVRAIVDPRVLYTVCACSAVRAVYIFPPVRWATACIVAGSGGTGTGG